MFKKNVKNRLSSFTRLLVRSKLAKYSCFDLNLVKINSILIIAPHPDDEIIGLGGLIIKAINNHCKVNLLLLTDGEASGAHKDLDLIKTKRRELSSIIVKQMGIPEAQIYRMELADGRVPREGEAGFDDVSEKLVTILEKEAPDLVFATHPLDFWPYDHVACAELAKAAFHKSNVKSQLYYYWVWAWYHLKPWQVSKIDFSSYLRIDIKNELPQKKQLISQYIEPLSSSKKPWSGVLPASLITGNTQNFEVIEKVNY
jgi:LmbE family N-acetylglucosaminyl deacetylase